MSIDIDEIERLAKAATLRVPEHPTDKQLDEWLRECSGPMLWTRDGGIRMSLIRALKNLTDLASPAVVLELIARLRNAEGIVRDLAASEPKIPAHEIYYPSCALCKASIAEDDYHDDRLDIPHVATCPYRRAVEAQR